MKAGTSIALVSLVSLCVACGGVKKVGDISFDDEVPDVAPDTGGDVPHDLPDGAEVPPDTPADVETDGPDLGRPVDILVVVDNSQSMAEEQRHLVSDFPSLISGILDPASSETPVRSLHIGVVSTDMGTGGYDVTTCPDSVDGDDGILMHTPSTAVTGCDSTYPLFLDYASESPDATLIAWITKGFECIATLGIEGCGFEQPLKAARKALIDHRDGENAGFLRPDSVLVVVFLSDEDDCSVAAGEEGIFDPMDTTLGHMTLRCFANPEMLDPVTTYNTQYATLRASPDDLYLAFIAGVPQGEACEGPGDTIPTCLDQADMVERVGTGGMTLVPACGATSMTGGATPGRRFVAVAQNFSARAHVESICAPSYTRTMNWIVARIQGRL